MKKITEDDLTLLYYGEHNDPGLAARVAASPELAARFDALGNELGKLDNFLPPELDDDYGADVWQKIAPALEADRRPSFAFWETLKSVLGQPRFSLAGALSLTLVAALAFMLGRQGSQPVNNVIPGMDGLPATAMVEMHSDRVLTSSVSGHLEQLNLALTQFANTPDTSASDAELVTDLLLANRLYRQAAVSRDNHQLAAFLSDLEPLLIELAYEAHKTSPSTRSRMQKEIKDSLLLRVRIMNKQLNQSGLST